MENTITKGYIRYVSRKIPEMGEPVLCLGLTSNGVIYGGIIKDSGRERYTEIVGLMNKEVTVESREPLKEVLVSTHKGVSITHDGIASIIENIMESKVR